MMTSKQSDAYERFVVELDRLYAAAGSPSPGRIASWSQKNHSPGIASSTITGWLGLGRNRTRRIPRRSQAVAFSHLVEFLLDRVEEYRSRDQHTHRRQPSDLAAAQREWEDRREAAEHGRPRATFVGVRAARPDLLRASTYVRQVREFLSPLGGLQDREEDRAMLAEFSRGDEPYLWIRGAPWSGKSALLATFMLDPPQATTVIGFFVTKRLAAQNDQAAYTAAILEQLAALLPDEKARIETTTLNRDGLRADLITTAARREAEAGRRLVLVVDGLDEDIGEPSIAGLLPTRMPDNLRVIVASRYGPRHWHPVGHPAAVARRFDLTASEFATGLRQMASDELDLLLNGTDRDCDVLALITTARGLSISELVELTDLRPSQVEKMLTKGLAARSFRASTTPARWETKDDAIYALAHDTLEEVARRGLGDHVLATALDRLHDWSGHYHDRRWPTHTPDFLFHRYFTVLERHRDFRRMHALALDADRHERMHAHTGSDVAALAEISASHHYICGQPDPDLLASARLALHRDELQDRISAISHSLLALLAQSGQIDRALILARRILEPGLQGPALLSIAEVIAHSDPDLAGVLIEEADALAVYPQNPHGPIILRLVSIKAEIDVDEAETIARAITEPDIRSLAIAEVALAIATKDPSRAEGLARCSDSPRRDRALAGVAKAFAHTDSDHALHLAQEIGDRYWRAQALADIANTISERCPAKANELVDDVWDLSREIEPTQLPGLVAAFHAPADVDRAELMARGLRDRRARNDILAVVAHRVARRDPDRGEGVAYSIDDSRLQTRALTAVAVEIVDTDVDRAVRIAERIGNLATHRNSSTAPSQPPQTSPGLHEVDIASPSGTRLWVFTPDPRAEAAMALADVAAAIQSPNSLRAAQIIDRATALARLVEDRRERARTLESVARAALVRAPELATDLLDEAVASSSRVQLHTDVDRSGAELSCVIQSVARVDTLVAEALADTIVSHRWRAHVLRHIAGLVGDDNPSRAEALVKQAVALSPVNEDLPWKRSKALAEQVHETALTDIDRAEAQANLIDDRRWRASALADLAEVIAATDAVRALEVVDGLDVHRQVEALARIAVVVADRDPQHAVQLLDRAEIIARNIADRGESESALSELAEDLAWLDPDRAEAIAQSLGNPKHRAAALSRIAMTIAWTAATDQGRHAQSLPAAPQRVGPARSKHLLARAWSIGPWLTPVQALPLVDAPTLLALASDLLNESQNR